MGTDLGKEDGLETELQCLGQWGRGEGKVQGRRGGMSQSGIRRKSYPFPKHWV